MHYMAKQVAIALCVVSAEAGSGGLHTAAQVAEVRRQDLIRPSPPPQEAPAPSPRESPAARRTTSIR